MKRVKKALILTALTVSMPLFASELVKADVFRVQKAHDVAVNLKYPAVISPAKKVDVVARVLGILKKKHFQEGEYVQKGALLYEIEESVYKAERDSAKAFLELAEVTLKNASRKWKRAQQLYLKKATSQESRDDAQAVFEEAQARVAIAKASLEKAELNFNYTKLRAPISGFTGLKHVDVGSLVHANQTKLITLTQNKEVFVEFSMPLSDFKNLKSKKWSTKNAEKIKLKLLDAPEQGLAEVDFIDVNINQQTSVVKLRAKVQNSDNSLMAGKFTRVLISNVYQNNSVEIPQQALLQDENGMSVYVVEEGVVKQKAVEVERENAKNFIVKAGVLKSGDKVLVNNFFRVRPEQTIQIDNVIN